MSNNSELNVIFGTGPVGLSVARALIKRGKIVRMINRSGKAAEAPEGIEIIATDAYNAESALLAAQGATVIYQCAQPRYTEWREKFPPLQTNLLEVAAALNAKFIVAENLYMYGDVDGAIHEGLPYNAHTKKGCVRAEMAEALHEAHRGGKVRTASARASDFYGPTVRQSLVGERMFKPLLAGKAAQMIGNLDMPHSISYIDDFGEVLAIIGERDEALGRAWHVPNAKPLTQREMVQMAAQAAGVAPKVTSMGKGMLRIGGIFIPEAREIIELMYEFEKPYIVDDSNFRRVFADTLKDGIFPMNLEEGFRRTMAWYQAGERA